jgi:tRNA pseudouridine55 synthase
MMNDNTKDFSKIPLVFNLYKPVGISSFQVVHHFKKNLNFDFGKIGHFGTLDPFAEGVLLVGIQGAQKLNDYVHEFLPKTYQALGVFGKKTSSGDMTTEVLEIKDIDENFQKLSREELEKILVDHFLGEYWQSPHSISATKFEGKRLYQHALEGRIIQKEKVKREIISFKVLSFEYPFMRFEVKVSSGTYIRSLFEEIAHLFNGVGVLKELIRTAIGDIYSVDSINQSDWPIKSAEFNLETNANTLDVIFPLNSVFVGQGEIVKYLRGQSVLITKLKIIENSKSIYSQNLFWVYSESDFLLGLAKIENDKLCTIFNLKEAIALFSSTY